MKRKVGRAPSGAMVVALIALCVAMSGTSYGADARAVVAKMVTGAQIKDGSIGLKDLSKSARKSLKGARGVAGAQGATGAQGAVGAAGPKGDLGPAGPTFGDTTSSTGATVTGCGPSTLATQTVTVARPSRILASAGGAWARDSTNLNTGTITVSLLQSGVVVATSPQAFASNYAATTSRSGMAVTAVLYAGSNPFPVTPTAYVADPGTYTLRLDGSANDGSCTGTSTFWRPWMTYALLGTSP
jgi:hypothetical protein